MSIYLEYPGTRGGRGKLHGGERTLDLLIGLVLEVASLLVATLGLSALSEIEPHTDGGQVGFWIALIGSGIVLAITTLIYLVRIIIGRRSWVAPLWGFILSIVIMLVGFWILAS